jgi:hypothetical protein
MQSRVSTDQLDALDRSFAKSRTDSVGNRNSTGGAAEKLLSEHKASLLLNSGSQPAWERAFYSTFGLKQYDDVFERDKAIEPQMYKFHNIGLYAHYGALGLVGAIAGLCYNFCYYSFEGSDNVCANSYSLIFVPWGFKIFFAMVTDSYRPWGLRRKSYMLIGWGAVLLLTLVLALAAEQMNVSVWLAVSVGVQFFLMVADVPADGYCVELGQLETGGERGMVLSNGQRIRFAFTMLGGVIQAFLVNGPSTNDSDCAISVQDCWSWGLTVQQYYWLIFIVLVVLCIPIVFFREIDSSDIPQHTLKEHSVELWGTMCNPTTLYLLIFVTGNALMSNMVPITTTYVQYVLIQLTNLQSGITAIVTYLAVWFGVTIFQKYFITKNWRTTLYLSVFLAQSLGLMWLLVYYNVGGLLNPWFTIFITLNQSVAQGLSQVLFSMAVIELAKQGQEAVTYELIISVANSCSNLSTIVATQLLTPMKATTCDTNYVDDDVGCEASQVNLYNFDNYKETDGPAKFTKYQLLILGINVISCIVFTRYLPRQKDECQEWKLLGQSGHFFLSSLTVGRLSVIIAVTIVTYQIIASVMLFNPETSCLPAFGGSGC